MNDSVNRGIHWYSKTMYMHLLIIFVVDPYKVISLLIRIGKMYLNSNYLLHKLGLVMCHPCFFMCSQRQSPR